MSELNFLLSPFDIKRLESYANNALDYHVILDLLPTVGSLYFNRRLGKDVKLSAVQSAITLALGLQRKTIEEVEVCQLTRQIIFCAYAVVTDVVRAELTGQPSSCIICQSNTQNYEATAGHSEGGHWCFHTRGNDRGGT